MLEEHLKTERADRKLLLNRLSELNEEVFTFQSNQGVTAVEQDNKRDMLLTELRPSQEMIAQLGAKLEIQIGTVIPELQTQVLTWKCQAMKSTTADARLAQHNALFKEHTLLKLEALAWRQKSGKREARWNELKGELERILNAALLPTMTDEVAYCQQLAAYRMAFPDFKPDSIYLPGSSSSSGGSSANKTPQGEITFRTPVVAIRAEEQFKTPVGKTTGSPSRMVGGSVSSTSQPIE
ncbi:unnamed protein product [Sphagnum balticum]